MSYTAKQVQSFNGKEQVQIKQGAGRFNLFTPLEDLWNKYFKAKVEAVSSPYTKLVGEIDSLAETLTIFENTTGKIWTLENVSTGNVELTADSTFDNENAVLLVGACEIPGSYVYGFPDPTFVRIQFLDASGITYTDMVIQFELRLY